MKSQFTFGNLLPPPQNQSFVVPNFLKYKAEDLFLRPGVKRFLVSVGGKIKPQYSILVFHLVTDRNPIPAYRFLLITFLAQLSLCAYTITFRKP